MKRFVVVVAVVSILSVSLSFYVCSASDVQSSSALSYFSGGTYSWNSIECDTEIWTAVRDWSIPFPDNVMVKAGYFSQKNNLGVRFEAVNAGTVYPNTMMNVSFSKPMNFVSGMTYQFCFRINSFSLYDSNGNGVDYGGRLISVQGRDSTSQVFSFSFTQSSNSNYSTDFILTYQPSEDVSISSLLFLFSGNGGRYYSIIGSFTFSNMICFSGDGNYISTDPQLDSISGQLDDIYDAFHNNPYGELTGVPADNPADLVGEDAALQRAEGILNRAELIIDGMPSGTVSFWSNTLEILFGFPIFVPFIVVGVGFILTRSLLGR